MSRRDGKRRAYPAVVLLALVLACAAPARADGPSCRAVVSIDPLAWLVERLAGDGAEVRTALAPGESPASFDPTPRRLARLSGADLYLCVGVPMERILLPHLRRTEPRLLVRDLAAGLARPAEDDHEHGHGHDHGALDPHVWLSPRLMARMADTAHAVLSERCAAGDEAAQRRRLEALHAELAALDADLAAALAPAAGRTMVVFHPAFGYLARDYGFTQLSIEKDGLPPTPRHLAEVLAEIRGQGVRAVFVQPQSASDQLRALAAAEGLRLEVLDPLARDYPSNLRRMAAVIGAALAPREPETAP